jgi:hypothetical protein
MAPGDSKSGILFLSLLLSTMVLEAAAAITRPSDGKYQLVAQRVVLPADFKCNLEGYRVFISAAIHDLCATIFHYASHSVFFHENAPPNHNISSFVGSQLVLEYQEKRVYNQPWQTSAFGCSSIFPSSCRFLIALQSFVKTSLMVVECCTVKGLTHVICDFNLEGCLSIRFTRSCSVCKLLSVPSMLMLK